MSNTKDLDVRVTECAKKVREQMERVAEAKRHDYRSEGIVNGKHVFSVDLNLNEQEQVSLRLALRAALDSHGVSIVHGEVVDSGSPFHPNSHIGTLVNLYRRVDDAYHGRKTWNQRRK